MKNSNASLAEVNATVPTKVAGAKWRTWFAFFGPAYLVSVGYMDPGNWATDIAGGSKFGYSLLWVLLMSNLIALLLQSLSARLGIVRGLDLAQASRQMYPKATNLFLYVLAEIAIAACDLAEVLGMAIGLQLLFDIPLIYGVCICVLDTFLLLFLLSFGMRKLEAFIICLISIIGFAFLSQLIMAKPDLTAVAKGFIPAIPTEQALYIAIGIIGATVMPHNLYLHSSLVQTRKFDLTPASIARAIRLNFFDSAIALNLALFVNAAILILAATVFFKNGLYEVAEIQDAHKLLQPMLGSTWAPTLFAIALIAAGQSSTITGTLAGQIIMEGYLQLRIQPWVRRLITRLIAVVPALITILYAGESATGNLLILSQVILSMQLGFAIIPLIHLTSDRIKMQQFAISNWVKTLAWISASIIVALNVKLVYEQINIYTTEHPHNIWMQALVIPFLLFAFGMLLYITIYPYFTNKQAQDAKGIHGTFTELTLPPVSTFKRIAIAVDFTKADEKTIQHALQQGGLNASYLLIHTVETAGAFIIGANIKDAESESDAQLINHYEMHLKEKNYQVVSTIGYGNPKKAIPQLTIAFDADLLVMGSHGHRAFSDIIWGTTIDAVRHQLNIPVLVVRL
ncbi:MAG: Nramp family divalent metal transporter [Bacteroidia bacterium]|nr:Nramp family divalent metal transporter [Bacteroidia bacterium]HQV00586.1 Nramp family divalent metal transporter [Bacteroidia bacterium]